MADVIRVKNNDLDKILDFIEDFPTKTIIYEMDSLADRNTLKMYNEKLQNFIIEVKNGALIPGLVEDNFKCAWHYPANTFYDLKTLVEYNVAYIMLGEPLCFDLDSVKNITGIPLHMRANVAYEPYLVRKNGVCGKWVRPEDVPIYEPYIDTLEFYSETLQKEATLFKIYRENKSWPGNLNLLIDSLNYNVDNRALSDKLATTRLNCGQRCMKNGDCHLCETEFQFAELLRKISESKQQITPI